MNRTSSTVKPHTSASHTQSCAESKEPPSTNVEEFLRIVTPNYSFRHSSTDTGSPIRCALSTPLVQQALAKLQPIQQSLEFLPIQQSLEFSYANYGDAMPTPTCKDLLIFEIYRHEENYNRQFPRLVNCIELQQSSRWAPTAYAPISVEGDYAVCRALICKFKCKSDNQVQLETEKRNTASKLAELQSALRSNQAALEKSKQLAREARSCKADRAPPVELHDIGALVTEQMILEDEMKLQTERQQVLQRQSFQPRTVCIYDTKRFPLGPVAVGNSLYILCKTSIVATAGPGFTVE